MDETKVDLKEDYKPIFSASTKEVTFVGIPAFNFLKIDGAGDPNTPAYQEAVKALYSITYAIKFANKSNEDTFDFTVPPLEGLWWCDDMKQFSVDKKDEWFWTLMVLQPDFISKAVFEQGMIQYSNKKKLSVLPAIRLEMLSEGKAVQSLHIGPYSTEGPLIASIHQYIKAKGCVLHGRHHEIYLNNPGKTAPEKMKTLIRQPFL